MGQVEGYRYLISQVVVVNRVSDSVDRLRVVSSVSPRGLFYHFSSYRPQVATSLQVFYGYSFRLKQYGRTRGRASRCRCVDPIVVGSVVRALVASYCL